MTATIVNLSAMEFAGFLLVIACAAGAAAAILDLDVRRLRRDRPPSPLLERERDLAANLGWRWRSWVVVRLSLIAMGIGLGLLSRIWILVFIGGLIGTFGFRFALAGRAASRRLRVERAFLGRLRDLRDRIAIGNQSLDTALQEIGRNPGPDLEYVLAPWARGGSVLDNIVAVGERARSPVVEYACAVLLWTRTRSLDALIEAIDELLLPVGEAQLAVQEEASVTLTQQRAVTIAMSVLMVVMFAVIVRVDAFRAYYQSVEGNVVLVLVVVIFGLLVGLLGVIVRVRSWTRWDLRRLAEEQEDSVPNDLWPYALLTVALVGVWALGLARLGYLTGADVRAWRRLAALRGYSRPQTRLERAAVHSNAIRRLQAELDLRRQLAVADRGETDSAFLARTVFLALLTLTVALALDTTSRVGGGAFFVPPWFAALLALLVVLFRFVILRAAARRRRENADRALGDMMMLVAIMTDGRGLQVEDAVRILSRCARTSDLRTLVEGGWRKLISTPPRSTADLYRAIGAEFGIGQFTLVADALTTTNVGIAERDTYTRVANAVYQQRLSEARMRAARARILVTLPVAGMLIPLLLLLGAPTFQSISSGLGGG